MKTLYCIMTLCLIGVGACAPQPAVPTLTSCPPTRTHIARYTENDVRQEVYQQAAPSPEEARSLLGLITAPPPASLECWYRSEAGNVRYERHSLAGGRIYLFDRTAAGWELARELAFAGP